MKNTRILYAIAPLIWAGVIILSVLIGLASNEVVGLALAVIGSASLLGFLMFTDPEEATEMGGK